MNRPGKLTVRLTPLLLLFVLLQGCGTLGPGRNVQGKVALNNAASEIPEDRLLDVWVELFDPGTLPEDAEAKGLSMDIRDAEARYMPEQLRATMEKTGHWGAVRLVPQGTQGGEIQVRGTILASDGEVLSVEITALDATGHQWFRRSYDEQAPPSRYRHRTADTEDVFQSLYNTIANDLAEHVSKLDAEQTIRIRRIAEMRFAADVAPDAFADYLRQDGDRFELVRLPALDDSMYRRVQAIRERDLLLVDTLNGHFDNFTREMEQPYNEWRRSRSEELAALRAVKQEALKRKLLGALAILGAVAVQSSSHGKSNGSNSVIRDVLVLGGVYGIKTGFDKSSESEIHVEAIAELDDSFSTEARPLVVEVDGQTHELTGSAEAQYAKWRELLKRIHRTETGLSGS